MGMGSSRETSSKIYPFHVCGKGHKQSDYVYDVLLHQAWMNQRSASYSFSGQALIRETLGKNTEKPQSPGEFWGN